MLQEQREKDNEEERREEVQEDPEVDSACREKVHRDREEVQEPTEWRKGIQGYGEE